MNIYKLSFFQSTSPNILVIFTDITMPKKESFFFDSLEVYKENRVIDESEHNKFYHFRNNPPKQSDRIATSITEVPDDIKKFELRTRSFVR